MRAVRVAVRRVWALPVGRLAVACVVIGVVGLTCEVWAAGSDYGGGTTT